MIALDTETTGLLEAELAPLERQPYIIEFGAIKLNDALEEVDRISFLCNPGFTLPAVITKITGLTDNDLKDAPTFAASFDKLANFFLGERAMVAHNMSFDLGILRYNLMRIGKLYNMPWPIEHFCTVEISEQLLGKKTSMTKFYEHLLNKPANQTHRAIGDVELLVDVVRELRKREAL